VKESFGKALVLSALCVLGAQEVGAANLYRWKNSEGSLVISDRPPPQGVEFETITTDSSVVRRVEGESPPSPVVPAGKQTEAAPAAEPEPVRSVYKKNPEYCERARKNLEILERPRIRIVENGEARFLSEEEREEQRAQAMESIAQNC